MELPERILQSIDASKISEVDSIVLSEEYGFDHQKIVGGIKSLQSLGEVIECQSYSIKNWQLTEEGELMVKNGSHEAVIFENVPVDTGIAQPDLMKKVGSIGKVGFSKAMSAGWITIDKSGGKPVVKRKVDSIADNVKSHLELVKSGKIDEIDNKARDDYKKRKLLHEVNFTAYKLSKGPSFSLKVDKMETELTPDMITNGSWKTANFKPYNFATMGISPSAGHLHPLLKVRAEYRYVIPTFLKCSKLFYYRKVHLEKNNVTHIDI